MESDSYQSDIEASSTSHNDAAEDINEEWFDPAQSSIELETLLQSLNADDDTDVKLEYERSGKQQNAISQLQTEVEDFKPSSYQDDFEHIVKNDLIMIGSMSKDELDEQERKIKEEQIVMQQQQLSKQQERKEEITRLTESAKKRVWWETKQQEIEAHLRDEVLKKRENQLTEQMKKAFRHSESQLQRALQMRQAEVNAFYGDLMMADNQFGDSKGRRWRVEWSKTPQPIQVKIQSIRGIRDKVPAGRYVLMLSLYDRLGGHAMRWSKLSGQQWGGATLPVYHDGRFSSSEIKIRQSVFTVLPPQRSVQPGMILAFELFLLRGAVSPTDRVVAWGCFPVCDGQFHIIQGCYKLPMLRGHMDPRISKHTSIERLISTDIDHWLANLYIQIYRLPRYLSGQKEYEVELQFSSGLLSYPDRIVNAEEAIDGEKIPDDDDEENPASTSDETRSNSNISVDLDEKRTFASGKRTSFLLSSSSSGIATDKLSSSHEKLSTEVRKRSIASRKKISTQDTPATDDEEDEVVPVEGHPGMFYQLHHRNPVEDYNAKHTATLIPQTPLLDKPKPRPKLTPHEDMERHTFSVQPPFSVKGRLQQHGHERAEYVARMFLSEMGISQWMTFDFWLSVFLLVGIWFLRIYVHYCGQWLLLQALALPVSSFVFFPYTVNLNYQDDLLSTAEELGVVVLGPIANIIIQILLILISWLSQLLLGTFPLIFSKFILVYSLWTVLDPIVILIVDAALGRYANTASQPIGDAFKLYWHFYRVEGSGVIGIPLIIFLYLLLIFVATVILYLYFLKLHNNGRILDVFHRLHGDDDSFFVPHDLELSNQELSFVVKKAEQWRGLDGERRKVTVYDYIWESDELDGGTSFEVTTHIAIHTLHLDGLRELYRHFLRLPDGAIVEVFGELGSTNLTPDVKTALLKTSNVIENVIAPSISNPHPPSSPSNSLMERSKNFLDIPTESRERPLTSDSVRTRATLRCDDSSDSSSAEGAPAHVIPDVAMTSSTA